MTNYGDLSASYSGLSGTNAYGYIPRTPNPLTTASQAIAGGLGNIGDLGTLADLYSRATTGAATTAMEMAIPGYQGLLGQQTANLGDWSAGLIPSDVVANMGVNAAEFAAKTGQAPDSPMANAALRRALGLTSLDLQQKGLAGLQSLMKTVPTGAQMNLATMIPDAAAMQYWSDVGAIRSAAPDPTLAAMANFNAAAAGANRWGGGGAAPPPTTQPTTTTPTTTSPQTINLNVTTPRTDSTNYWGYNPTDYGSGNYGEPFGTTLGFDESGYTRSYAPTVLGEARQTWQDLWG